MNIECKAKKEEQDGLALYKVPLQRIQGPDGDLWALSVPGVREDNPHIEMGDILSLRQLWVDSFGKLMNMPNSGGPHPLVPKCWTGVQYDASIYSIERAREIVYLKVEGLRFLPAGWSGLSMEVNICFPLKENLLRAQRGALASVHLELKKAIRTEYQYDSMILGDSRGNFKDISWTSDDLSPEKLQQSSNNDWICRMLFPTEDDGQLQTKLRKIPHRALFDHAVNYEQAHAVNDVCINDYGTLPYLISGPPGTGKTKTLVETAMQMLNTTDIAHILICAPSEAAADTLTVRLKQYLNNKQLFRLNRPNRADNEVPPQIIQHCYMENDMFCLPPFKTLMTFNVVVTSCRDATILTDARLTNNDFWTLEQNMLSALHPEEEAPVISLHWGALLIDETAQAVEVDVLPAMSAVCPPSRHPPNLLQPRFVMAGDENQLGPRTSSRDLDFSTSLFARLFDRPLYKNHPLSRSNVNPSSGPPVLKSTMLPIIYPPFTLLFRNYRSHPAILSIPSSLFYNDTLIPEASTPSTPLQRLQLWRGRRWPVLFVPHNGPDELERDGGGWYNISEARTACDLAQRLVTEGRVQQSDICIMSPFAAQVKVLRSLIRSNRYGVGSGLWYVNIGPLEAFQGLENRAVIICTTRTRERFLERDEKAGFGIVRQKRKMNVALTRAKEALIVIGSPAVLGTDEHWREWLAFCWRNGLVADEKKVWKGAREGYMQSARIGVLERVLIARDERSRRESRPALGAGTAELDIGWNAEYEGWVESLREALDDEDDEEFDELDEVYGKVNGDG